MRQTRVVNLGGWASRPSGHVTGEGAGSPRPEEESRFGFEVSDRRGSEQSFYLNPGSRRFFPDFGGLLVCEGGAENTDGSNGFLLIQRFVTSNRAQRPLQRS